MKHLKTLLVFLIILQSCIENDIVNDRVNEKLSINNTIEQLTLNTTHQYTTKYTNNVGKVTNPTINWSSSQPSIVSINNNGLITALKEGKVIITVSTTTEQGKVITTNNSVSTTKENIDNNGPKEKSGTIRTTSSYTLTGTFTLKEIPNTNDLELSINSDYRASSSLPGLYLYMTNNPNTVSGAKEIAKVSVYNGAHKYTIKNTSINDFGHLLYWCKPFRVKVGDAEIE